MKNKYLIYMVAFLIFGMADLFYLNSKVIPSLWPEKKLTAELISTEKNVEEPDNIATRQVNPTTITPEKDNRLTKIKADEKESFSSESLRQIDRPYEKDKSKNAPLIASNNIEQIKADVNPMIIKNNNTAEEEKSSQKPSDGAIKGQNEDENAQPTLPIKIVVRFNNGEYELPPNYRKMLLLKLKKVAIDETVFVTIDGHTDRRGTVNFDNQQLSQQRADYVAVLLKQQGILENQITAIGHGDSQPLDSNDTLAAYEKNRRAEIKIFKDKP